MPKSNSGFLCDTEAERIEGHGKHGERLGMRDDGESKPAIEMIFKSILSFASF